MATSAAETSGTTSSGTHRKIELETNDDLRHLIQLARNAATQHLDRDLPRTEGEDEYRAKVEELVHAVRSLPSPLPSTPYQDFQYPFLN